MAVKNRLANNLNIFKRHFFMMDITQNLADSVVVGLTLIGAGFLYLGVTISNIYIAAIGIAIIGFDILFYKLSRQKAL